MVLEKINPKEGLDISLAYGTPHNFTGQLIYQNPVCYLHQEAAVLLEKARCLALSQNLGLRVYDAFRPTEAQWKLWEHVPDPDYVADPRKGSPHGRGIAVDLTLYSLKSQEALDMGTDFDDLREKSHHGRADISTEAQKNRYLLLGIMMSAGWDLYMNEWWHYQLFKAQTYPLLSDREAPEPMMTPQKHAVQYG